MTLLLGSPGVTQHSHAKVSVTKFTYKLSFHDYSPTLKPSLIFSARVRNHTTFNPAISSRLKDPHAGFLLLQLKICEYDGEPLTKEDHMRTVHLSVTQKKSWKWEMEREEGPWMTDMPGLSTTTPNRPEEDMPEENMPEEMELPISANGEVHLSIPVQKGTETLRVDVRCCPVSSFRSSCGSGAVLVMVQLGSFCWATIGLFFTQIYSMFFPRCLLAGLLWRQLHLAAPVPRLHLAQPLLPEHPEASGPPTGQTGEQQQNNKEAPETAACSDSLCVSAPRAGRLSCSASPPQ